MARAQRIKKPIGKEGSELLKRIPKKKPTVKMDLGGKEKGITAENVERKDYPKVVKDPKKVGQVLDVVGGKLSTLADILERNGKTEEAEKLRKIKFV